MSTSSKSPSEQLDEYIRVYLEHGVLGDEFEVRFGTKFWNPITEIDFENVISKLKSLGFRAVTAAGSYHLNVQNEFVDPKTGKTRTSNVRTSIGQLHNIQEYCRKNTFDLDDPPRYVSFLQKTPKIVGDQRLSPIDFDDFQFRANYKHENSLSKKSGIVQGILQRWNESKKVFRLIKRFTFTHKDYPVKVDCSIVRSSKKVGNRLVPEFRIESSGVFKNPEAYEIEIELDTQEAHALGRQPSAFFAGRSQTPAEKVATALRSVIKIVLSGLQGTNFPISYKEQDAVLANYLNILHKGKRFSRRARSKDFVGPSSISLELSNIAPLGDDSRVANIRTPYTVTDKADGIRKLLVIANKGRVYLIDVNMKVQFTGMVSSNNSVHQTIIDGEHVLHDKYGKFINTYLAFDIYYESGKDLRSLPFCESGEAKAAEDKGETETKYRLNELNATINSAAFGPVVGKISPLRIEPKTFYVSNGNEIFDNCAGILQKKRDGLFPYEIDGLIFTPVNKGVGSDTTGEVLPPVKRTWLSSLKWKPPEFNTIDFLVTTKKTESGQDYVGNIFEEGTDMYVEKQLTQYKTLILRVGFDERRHGYLNPCEDVIQDRLPSVEDGESRDRYKPVPFYPTDPTPNYPAYVANVVLQSSPQGKHLTIEDGEEAFGDNTIVEFRYDEAESKFWQWKPIRVRKRKTAEYLAGGRNYGNAYHVAQSVWRSIHNPVTENMITTGKNIPDATADDTVYYNRGAGESMTKALRNFHNLFVKRVLILGVSKKGGTLIDMTVGKGGDFPKWLAAKLSFVFGLDVSSDNIENRLDGACARFLNYKKKYRSVPYSVFVNGNSALNIRSGEAAYTEKGKQITRAIFGEGAKDESKLGKGIYRQYGKGKDGFDVVSNQFSIHYFFKDKEILNSFLRNISEACKVGGYFIGTSYDGRRVFRELEKTKVGDSVTIFREGKKVWEVRKQYASDVFKNDVSCLGYQIDVYQESINKVFPEYLVNYEYLTRLIANYGFALVGRKEAQRLGLPNSIGNFQDLFVLLEEQVRTGKVRRSDVGQALRMSPEEKRISFLNKYFVFKKVRDVNAEETARVLSDESVEQVKSGQEESAVLQETLEVSVKPAKVKKLKSKIKLKPKVKVESAPATVKIKKVRKRRGKIVIKAPTPSGAGDGAGDGSDTTK